MIGSSITLQSVHCEALTAHLLREDGRERAAYLLCGRVDIQQDPWDGVPHQKFLSHEVIPVPDEELLVSTISRVTWRTDSFVSALKRAKAKGLIVGIAHSHPFGQSEFSTVDNSNEPDLVHLAINRNGPGTQMVSLLFSSLGLPAGRVWLDAQTYESLNPIRILGDEFRLDDREKCQGELSPTFNRQILAFGKALTENLRRLRIGVVGCGGTGSAVAMLLSRLGVGKLLLLDYDVVDQTNLNRLHGACQADADAKHPKVEVVSRAIRGIGIGVDVRTMQAWVNDTRCRDPLKSCDIIFGCSDDNQGRLLLNRFAYYYLVPVIDMGLAIEVTRGEPPIIQTLDGRVTVLGPSHTCLLCRGVINTEIARSEALRRANPQEYDRQKKEAYVIGEGEPNPAVVTFTTEVATMAVNEMLHRLQGFRGSAGATAQRTRLFHRMHDLRPGEEPLPDCQVCGRSDAWGRGDVDPFLDRIE